MAAPTSVPFQVERQGRLVCEPSRAQWAAVRSLSRVAQHVRRQVALGLERQRAPCALEVPDAAVGGGGGVSGE